LKPPQIASKKNKLPRVAAGSKSNSFLDRLPKAGDEYDPVLVWSGPMEFTPELENNRNMEIVPPQLWSNSPTPVCVAGSNPRRMSLAPHN